MESQDQIEDPVLKDFAQDCVNRINQSAENLILGLISSLLSEGDVIILSLMGIDGRQKILDVLIEQCEKLKKEFEDE